MDPARPPSSGEQEEVVLLFLTEGGSGRDTWWVSSITDLTTKFHVKHKRNKVQGVKRLPLSVASFMALNVPSRTNHKGGNITED